MSDPRQPSWKHPLFVTALVVLGSFAIFFPAWLPANPSLPTEDGIVEGMQMVLLLAGGAFWFGAARAAGKTAPFYRIMGIGGLAAALGESDSLFEGMTGIAVEFIFLPLGIYALFLFYRNRKNFGAFMQEFVTHPVAGFYASALLMIYVLARFLGTSVLWKASLGPNYHSDIPATVEAYLELLACYLLLVGTIGLCLSPRRHDPTEFD